MSDDVFWVQFCVNYAVLLAGLIASILAGLSPAGEGELP